MVVFRDWSYSCNITNLVSSICMDTGFRFPGGPEWPKAVDRQVSSPIRLVDTLTPEGVIEAVGGALPLQRKAVEQSYIGIKVSWQGAISDMSRWSETPILRLTDTNLVTISLRAGRVSLSVLIVFDVNPDEYPGLELLQEGDTMSVEGEIVRVDRLHVGLANARVSF